VFFQSENVPTPFSAGSPPRTPVPGGAYDAASEHLIEGGGEGTPLHSSPRSSREGPRQPGGPRAPDGVKTAVFDRCSADVELVWNDSFWSWPSVWSSSSSFWWHWLPPKYTAPQVSAFTCFHSFHFINTTRLVTQINSAWPSFRG